MARRFHFRLAAALRVAGVVEDQARAQVAHAAAHLRDAELAEAVSLAHATDVAAAARRSGATADVLADRARAVAAATTHAEARDEVTVAGRLLADAQERWALAARDLDALQRLHDRRLAEHQAEALRAEAAETDDLVSARAARKVMAER